MLDDLERLRTNPALRALLNHYADLAEPGREIWQDRLMVLDGVDAAELSRLHGQLIACDWIEQNTGHCGAPKAGVVTGCYRVTPAGLRAMRLAQLVEIDEGSEGVVAEAGEALVASSAVILVATVAGDVTQGPTIPADADSVLEIDAHAA